MPASLLQMSEVREFVGTASGRKASKKCSVVFLVRTSVVPLNPHEGLHGIGVTNVVGLHRQPKFKETFHLEKNLGCDSNVSSAKLETHGDYTIRCPPLQTKQNKTNKISVVGIIVVSLIDIQILSTSGHMEHLPIEGI